MTCKNREARNRYARRYYKKNRKKVLAYARRYRAEHREAILDYSRRYRAKEGKALTERHTIQQRERRAQARAGKAQVALRREDARLDAGLPL